MHVVYDITALGETLVVNVYQYFYLRRRYYYYWRLRLRFPSAAELQARLRNCAFSTIDHLPSPFSNKLRSLVTSIYPPTATIVQEMDDVPPSPTLESHTPLPSFRPMQPTSPVDPFRGIWSSLGRKPSPAPPTLQPTSATDPFRNIRFPPERVLPTLAPIDTPSPPQVSYTISSTVPTFLPPSLTSPDVGRDATVPVSLLFCSLLLLFAVLHSLFRRTSHRSQALAQSSHIASLFQDDLPLVTDFDAIQDCTAPLAFAVSPVQDIPGAPVSRSLIVSTASLSTLGSLSGSVSVSVQSITVPATPSDSESSGSGPLEVPEASTHTLYDTIFSTDGACKADKSGDTVSSSAMEASSLVTEIHQEAAPRVRVRGGRKKRERFERWAVAHPELAAQEVAKREALGVAPPYTVQFVQSLLVDVTPTPPTSLNTDEPTTTATTPLAADPPTPIDLSSPAEAPLPPADAVPRLKRPRGGRQVRERVERAKAREAARAAADTDNA